jgi:hypothetical protein
MDDFSSNGGLWLFAILALMWGGGFGGFGNAGFANAIGYQNLATQNDVQRGFDNQNSMGNQREILAAVNSGTAQSVAATNQVYHDIVGYVGDKYSELDRDILTVGAGVQQAIANQNECCCNTLRAIDGVNYNNALNTAAINSNLAAGFNSLREKLDQNKIDALQNRVNQLELREATGNTVKYPTTMSYTAGFSPFCNCGFNGLYA